MARVLESLRPLVSLLLQAADPIALAERFTTLADGHELRSVIVSAVTDDQLVEPALTYAGITDANGEFTAAAPVLLAQAQALTEMAHQERWELVLTVPAFLREAHKHLAEQLNITHRPRETGTTISEVAVAARTRLLIAAPYLHPNLVTHLAPPLARLLRAGGTATVITRAISRMAPQRSNANAEAVAALRHVASQNGGGLTVRSWEEDGIGVHFKIVIADDRLAYLGSANLTPGGTVGHAEAGVLVTGTQVGWLARWLETVAAELARRRLPSA